MNIVILDDEEKIIEYVKEVLKKEKSVNDKIYSYTSYLDLEKLKNIDILFIDIRLGNVNGIDLVKKYKKELSNTKIIYITAYDEYIEETFETEPTYFLRKPLNEEKILKAYSKAKEKINIENQKIIISTKTGKRKINLNEIYYIESDARLINIYLKNEIITSYKKLSETEEELGNSFLRTHKSYIVNINKIKNYALTKITLENDKIIPISRHYQKRCKDAILEYLKEDEE